MVVKSSVLKELEECYREPGNQLAVLYGRTDSEKAEAAWRICAEQEAFLLPRETGGGARAARADGA